MLSKYVIMTILQLEYLNAIAQCGSFSAAAEVCFVTQPSLSTQIKNLEEELGVVLLNRNVKPLTLTEAGRIVHQEAQKAAAAFQNVKEVVSTLKGEVKGVLKLAVIPTIAPYFIHRFVPHFIKRYPGVGLEVKEMFTRDIERALRYDTIDIGILAAGFTSPANVVEEKLFSEKLMLYVSEKHPMYGKGKIAVGDIDPSDMVMLSEGHCLRDQVVDLCSIARKLNRGIRFESGSLETIMRIVDATGKVTIIPEMAYMLLSEQKNDNVLYITDGRAERDISMATSHNFYKKGIYDALKSEIIKLENKF